MNNNKRILILGGNFFPEPTGIGKYNGEMAEWLTENGFEVAVVTTFPYYPQWKVQAPYTKRRFWFKKEMVQASKTALPLSIYRCPHYVPAKPSGLKRMISDFSNLFGTFIIVVRLLFARKYDYVLTVAPPFQTGLLAIFYKKLKGAKTLYHVQDLQIDAAKDLGMIKSDFLLKTLFKIEKYILRKTDYISTISLGMINRIKTKTDKQVLFLPNWVQTDKYFPIKDKGLLKEQFGILSTDKVVLYSGAIGEKQGIEAILYAAEKLKNIQNIKFVICGSGPYKEKLMEMRKQMKLDNILFLPLQPHEKFNDFLNMADLHLVLQKGGASDLVMPSKLSTILAVGGVAIVSALSGTGLYSYVNDNGIGIIIEPENQEALERGIQQAILTDQEQIKRNARLYAEKYLAIDSNLSAYFSTVTNDYPKLSKYSSPSIAGQ